MAYIFEEITIRTDNSILGIERINALWNDVNNGRLAVLFDSEGNLEKNCENCTFPIACYSNYENDDKGMYNVSIKKVDSKFFADMEDLVTYGKYVRYKSSSYDIETAMEEAWSMVKEDSKNGVIKRAFLTDYENNVLAEFTSNKKARCYLYISVL